MTPADFHLLPPRELTPQPNSQENGLRSLAHISELYNLQSLHLGYNRINDISTPGGAHESIGSAETQR